MSEKKQRPENTDQWTEEDWYQNNVDGGMSEAHARLAAAQEVGRIDIDDDKVVY